ncbi:putative NADPH-dependent methylglyoxal reductase GRE2 [Daldinia vernicosa]|uniref:putative NADPH-dependent methylglyoxal reductase GRE2 n=1 Tax=Daldinia vernicosa TaxID=114800 RepID=UPI002007D883|nr:putative NADPH-dependent methylglyoxal reductase GRE2 [Daldinia vernicosa]KAI0847001.1 putative NADPH-dependent methylglyoxal reductase GRE2 [Daldinia vernicosa]
MAAPHRVLLTGANGYIAQHVLSQLFEAGFSVRAVARSESKIDVLKKSFSKYVDTPQLDFGVVPDITVPGAFDDVLVSNPPFDIVLHTASPFFIRAVKSTDFLDPAIKGTTEILSGVTRVAPSVKRVVVTSSFAAIGDIAANPIANPPKIYTRDDWNPTTLEQALATDNPNITYPASKALAEKAAWDFVKEGKGNFELVTLNPPGVYGPLFDASQIAKPEDLNTSTGLIYQSLLRPGLKSTDPVPPTFLYLWVDVRDLAQAHVLAATKPEAANKRWFVVAGDLSHQEMANYLREALPEKRDVIPIGEPEKTQKPEGFYGASAPETEQVLGVKYRSAAESIKDLAPQLVEIEKRAAASSS